MPAVLSLCHWLEQSWIGAGVRQSLWAFPVIETVHLLGMAALLGTVAALDLRLMGLLLRDRPIPMVARRILPWAWSGFAAQAITGGLLFSSEAVHMYANPAFRVKMVLIVLAGIHALIFHIFVRREKHSAIPPAAAKIAGVTSLL